MSSCQDKDSTCYWEDARGYSIAPCTETFPLRHQNTEGFTFYVLADGTYASMIVTHNVPAPIPACGDGLFMEYPWISFGESWFQAPPLAPALDDGFYSWVERNPRVCGFAGNMYLDIRDWVQEPQYQMPDSEYQPPIQER